MRLMPGLVYRLLMWILAATSGPDHARELHLDPPRTSRLEAARCPLAQLQPNSLIRSFSREFS